MIFRYDNALDPQAKKFPSYPEHKHTVREIAPAKRPAFKDVLSEISGIIEAVK